MFLEMPQTLDAGRITGETQRRGWPRFKRTCTLAVAVTLVVAAQGQAAVPVQNVCGTISTNTTLSPTTATVYHLTCSTTIAAGTTVSLAPGTVIKADPGAVLDVNGTLSASGTSVAPVTLTSYKDDTVAGDTNGDGRATRPHAADWSGIYKSGTSGALSLAFTKVSYAEQVSVVSAVSASVTDSTFVRGPGWPYGWAGLQITAAGTINVSRNVLSSDGAFESPGGYSMGITVVQSGVSSTTVSGNTVQNADSTAISVSSPRSITVQDNTVSGGTGRAFELSSDALTPALISGNTASGDDQDVLAVSGSLAASWTLPYAGLPVVLTSGGLTIPYGKTLTLAAGTVVKSDPGAWLYVNGGLTANGAAGAPVVLTSIDDDSAGGDTSNDASATTAAAGDWGGINLSTGSAAPSAPTLKLAFTRVSYNQQTHVSSAKSVALTDSSFVRGPGAGLGVGGLQITASGPIAVKDNTISGLADPGVWSSQGISVTQSGSVTTATTTVSGNTVQHADSTAIEVSSPRSITVQNNTVSGGTARAYELSSDALWPTLIGGNTSTGNRQNVLAVAGSLAASWSLPYAGLPVVVKTAGLTVPHGKTLTLAAGTTLKGDAGAGLQVSGGLTSNGTAAAPVVLTSIKDDSAGGDTNSDAMSTTPAAGDWAGIVLSTGGAAPSAPTLKLAYTRVSHNQQTYVSSASSVSVTNSSFLRGPGSGYGVGGLQITASGPIAIKDNTVSGLANPGGWSSQGISVTQLGSGATATTTVSGNTVYNADSTAISVSSPRSITVQNNAVGGGTARAYELSSEALWPTLVNGNTATGDRQNVLAVSGRLAANWLLPYAGLPVVLMSGGLTVPNGKTMTLAAGTVLKADPNASLTVNGGLAANGTAAAPVSLTSIKDDSAGGDTNGDGRATSAASGDWSGVSLATGDAAPSAPTLKLAYARVRYSQSTYVSSASSVSVANSTFVRGTGYGYGVGGLQITASGPIAVTNSTISGVADPGVWSSQGISVTQSGSDTTATTTVSGNTVQNVDSTAVSVSSPRSITVQNNTVSGGTARAYELSSDALTPALISGNTASGDLEDVLAVSGTLAANWSLPYPGLPVVLKSAGLTVPYGNTLTLAAGTVLKGDPNASLQVNGGLIANGTAASPVVMTSIKDDSAGGDTNNDAAATTPAAGDWGAINVSMGSAAPAAPTLNLAFTRVSYDQHVYVSTASSVSVTNSTFVRGPGYGYGVGGLQITASGPIAVNNNTVSGLANPQGWSSQGISVTQGGSNVAATTTVSGNTVQHVDSTAVEVTSPRSITVQNNTVNGGTSRAYELHSLALTSALISGNTSTGNRQNVLAVSGALAANWSLPYAAGPRVVVRSAGLTIPATRKLTLAAGTVVKGDQNALLQVNGSLVANGTAASPVVLTSIKDDAAGGDTNGDGADTTPAAGDWAGINVASGASAVLNGTTLRYATTALAVANGGNAEIHGKVLNSTMGLSADTFVDAVGVDWGATTGPAPYGTGTPVAGSGVMFVPWTGYVPPPRPAVPPPPVNPPPTPPQCEDVLFVGVRGSGEPPQEVDGDNYSNTEQYNFGGPVYQTWLRFKERLDELRDPDVAIRPWGLRYTAEPVPNGDLSGILTADDFVASVWEGVYQLRWTVNYLLDQCGADTEVVLAGYSQGALVIHLAVGHGFLPGSEAIDRSRIAAITLIADPARLSNGEEALLGTAPPGNPGIWARAIQVAGYIPWGGSALYTPAVPTELTSPGLRTLSLCNEHDIVCDAWKDSNKEQHEGWRYTDLAITAGSVAATRVHQSLP